MVGWHHWSKEHEFEQTLGYSEGQGTLSMGSQRAGYDLVTEQQEGCLQDDSSRIVQASHGLYALTFKTRMLSLIVSNGRRGKSFFNPDLSVATLCPTSSIWFIFQIIYQFSLNIYVKYFWWLYKIAVSSVHKPWVLSSPLKVFLLSFHFVFGFITFNIKHWFYEIPCFTKWIRSKIVSATHKKILFRKKLHLRWFLFKYPLSLYIYGLIMEWKKGQDFTFYSLFIN